MYHQDDLRAPGQTGGRSGGRWPARSNFDQAATEGGGDSSSSPSWGTATFGAAKGPKNTICCDQRPHNNNICNPQRFRKISCGHLNVCFSPTGVANHNLRLIECRYRKRARCCLRAENWEAGAIPALPPQRYRRCKGAAIATGDEEPREGTAVWILRDRAAVRKPALQRTSNRGRRCGRWFGAVPRFAVPTHCPCTSSCQKTPQAAAGR